MRNSFFIFHFIILNVFFTSVVRSQDLLRQEIHPVFQVNQKDPTQDKPQSKLWFSNGSWWTILPDSLGPSVWQRKGGIWTRNNLLGIQLQGFPGKGDVFSLKNDQFIVLIGDCRINFVHLKTDSEGIQMENASSIPIPENCHQIETATIVQDSQGKLWVASDWNEQILVWYSVDRGKTWSKPIQIGGGISADDISVISRTIDGISVIWSNQLEDAIYEKTLLNGTSNWLPEIIVSKGNKTADDHLNTTLLQDGRLILVSKNSLDRIGEPQFVLRVRSLEGKWADLPFEDLSQNSSPTRPVITQLPNNQLIEIHTEGLQNGGSEISVNKLVVGIVSIPQKTGQ